MLRSPCRSASTTVLGQRDRLEVSRINARRLQAQVIENETARDRANLLLPHRAVRQHALAANLNAAVAAAVRFPHSDDPTRRFEPAIFDVPHPRFDPIANRETSGMARKKTHWVAGSVAKRGVVLWGDCGSFAATAHTQTGRIRRGNRCFEWPVIVAADKAQRVAHPVAPLRLLHARGRLSAPALAQRFHVRACR